MIYLRESVIYPCVQLFVYCIWHTWTFWDAPYLDFINNKTMFIPTITYQQHIKSMNWLFVFNTSGGWKCGCTSPLPACHAPCLSFLYVILFRHKFHIAHIAYKWENVQYTYAILSYFMLNEYAHEILVLFDVCPVIFLWYSTIFPGCQGHPQSDTTFHVWPWWTAFQLIELVGPSRRDVLWINSKGIVINIWRLVLWDGALSWSSAAGATFTMYTSCNYC